MKHAFLLFIFYCISVLGYSQNCTTERSQFIDTSIVVDENNVPLDSNQFYFPACSFPKFSFSSDSIDENSVLISYIKLIRVKDDSVTEWRSYSRIIPNQYDTSWVKFDSRMLLALEEPLLFNQPTKSETYRFLWLRTFNNPDAIRIEKTGTDYRLYWKVCKGMAGYEAGKLKKDKSKRITKEDWEQFQNLLNEFNFWNYQFKGKFPSEDGATWILEGSTPDRYLATENWSVSKGKRYKDACKFLIKLTGMRIKERDMY